MSWYYTRSGFTIYFTALNLTINLATRAIWWPEAELLSWNVPISVFVGMLVAQPMFSVNRWLKERHDQKMAALIARHKENIRILDEVKQLTDESNYREAMRLIDKFLADPSTGIEIEHVKQQ